MVQDDFVRAVRKGIGEYRYSGSYAASLLAKEKAHKEGLSRFYGLMVSSRNILKK